MKTISTIAAELRESNPSLGNPTARDLNNMLLVKGLICVVSDGKCPTSLGLQRGILKRVDRNDMGKRYCYPVYDERAEAYVKSLAIAYFAPRPLTEVESELPETSETTRETSYTYKYSRKDHEAMQALHRDRLILLEGPTAYWTYFQDAKNLCRIMGWNVYENRRNVPGVTFPKDQLETVLQSLDASNISWIVSGLASERLSSIASPVEPMPEGEPSIVEIGSYIRVLVDGNDKRSFFIRDGNETPMVACVSATGMVINTELPSYENDSITVDSPAGQALLGRQIGDTVTIQVRDTAANTINAHTYQVLDIK